MGSLGKPDRQCNTSYNTWNHLLFTEDSGMWAVWLGWHPAEKISVGPNGKLIVVGNYE